MCLLRIVCLKHRTGLSLISHTFESSQYTELNITIGCLIGTELCMSHLHHILCLNVADDTAKTAPSENNTVPHLVPWHEHYKVYCLLPVALFCFVLFLSFFL